ncbi:kinase [Novosphingobium sp. ZN18A2]|uniref:kinase n=1 Tax=Novosphingobium sp. ZN18A2 TaxID=3079861 RepID=UPI0030CB0B6F
MAAGNHVLTGGPDPALVRRLTATVAREQAVHGNRLLVVGITGAQGSGKSTLAAALADRLAGMALPTAILSLDDLYLTRAERMRLAQTVHPLFATRGVPGTHDVALGLSVIAALEHGEAARLPRFDKAKDDRLPESEWPAAPAGCRVLLFEGWCVGARPQEADALADPVNTLEATEDPHGIWRGHANAALGGPYRALFDRIDLLILLAAPGFGVVSEWREEQEAKLRTRSDGARVMPPAQVERFIRHYERITRHILAEMPARADVTVRLGSGREVLAIEGRG